MNHKFRSIISALIQPKGSENDFSIFDPAEQFNEETTDNTGIVRALNAAFFIILAGNRHPVLERAKAFLSRMADSEEWAEVSRFYLNGIDLIHREIDAVCENCPEFAKQMEILSIWMSNKANLSDREKTTEKIWSLFFPEAAGIRLNRDESIETLRRKRIVTITELNSCPITEPDRQILFTSNVLLSIPQESQTINRLPLSDDLKERLFHITREPQIYWYDHPIQIGVKPEKNEILYGLLGLDAAVDFERTRGNMSGDKIRCILSMSVTHSGLHDIARRYLKEELARLSGLKNIDLYVFTETDTQRLINEILVPAAERYLKDNNAAELLGVFGVDGEYGRHYSFLKAIAAFWNIFIDNEISATFKIDLDQVFPQKELVEEAGASAFEHLKTPLWGAKGLDCNGDPVELGMIAGALVNERDIGKSLFTPDVPFPERPLSADEQIFFSILPQSLATEAKMMMRYTTDQIDGKSRCIHRIHVTGGTNGILVDSLQRYRPFTPSFIGRAEDQAYILSVLSRPGTKLAYAHKDGLIMRHDKEAFAREAIQAAYTGKLIGDYVRILQFSAYARVLTNDINKLKDILGPFTGCFISRIPTTVVYLRFGLKAASFFAAGKDQQGLEFITNGVPRIMGALDFVSGEKSKLREQYEKERLGWNLYYDILSAAKNALKKDDFFALELCKKAAKIIKQSAISFNSE